MDLKEPKKALAYYAEAKSENVKLLARIKELEGTQWDRIANDLTEAKAANAKLLARVWELEGAIKEHETTTTDQNEGGPAWPEDAKLYAHVKEG